MAEMKEVRGIIGNKEVIFQTGKLAKQADATVCAQIGGTVVMTAVVAAKQAASEDRDFFPLTVDYRERTYAAGKIPGGFFKREGRPAEREILTCRLIDRSIRPLFPEDYLTEVQVSSVVLSVDAEHNPDVVGMLATSCALWISQIPFMEPVASIRVGCVDGEFIMNPTFAEMEESNLDLVLSGTRKSINMIEAGALEISEDEMTRAIEAGHKELIKIIDLQEQLRSACGKEKDPVVPREIPADITAKVTEATKGKFKELNLVKDKIERNKARAELYASVLELFDIEQPEFKECFVKKVFSDCEYDQVRNLIIKEKKRPDGRGFTDIRDISCEVGVLPRTHGSAVFTRGQTQSLAVATLGTKADEQKIDALEGESTKRFMLHYNFPSFSVGEVKPNRGPGRREIGHGALAERALKCVMPSDDEFPYTVRIVSDILESNGSSSMASVCAGTLCMMDAGVPMKAPVAGIALGLVTDGSDFSILTDIAGIEDHLGDMDFKVAGTTDGITALQLDLKISGISMEIIKQGFSQALDARISILNKIKAVIDAPRKELSEYAPRITCLQIKTDKIKDVIGPGGKIIKKIIEETGVTIDIDDTGKIMIASTNSAAAKAAIERIESITQEAVIGKVYASTVKRLMNFGAFCEIFPGTEGLVHVSELADSFVKNVEDVVKVGDKVECKVINIDDQGRINLSIKQAKPKE